MEKRTYSEVIAEIQRHWATEGMAIHSGDDGFSERVHDTMRTVGDADPGLGKNQFYGRVYRTINA